MLETLARTLASVSRAHPIRVAIDGVDAAGKTTLADELVSPMRALGRTVIRASVDDFHNPREIRYANRLRRGVLPESTAPKPSVTRRFGACGVRSYSAPSLRPTLRITSTLPAAAGAGISTTRSSTSSYSSRRARHMVAWSS